MARADVTETTTFEAGRPAGRWAAMQTNNVRWAIGILAAVSALSLTTPAWSDERGDRGRDHRGRDRFEHRRGTWDRHREREWRRHDWDRSHRAAWHFHRGHGWRFEHRPGIWSPHFVWWRVDGRPILRPLPTVRIVRYPTGYYELVGDGFTVPYYWVWRSTVVAVTPPPVPLPPPAPDYPFPPAGAYPPPPAPPTG
jgi:hypothetical protein